MTVNIDSIKDYFLSLQHHICQTLAAEDSQTTFQTDEWSYGEKGGGLSRVIEKGAVIEKGGVNFSHVKGDALPAAATKKRPELAGQPFEACGISLVIHPDNPFVPTSHMNLRFFVAYPKNTEPTINDQGEVQQRQTIPHEELEPVWWFGGGFDLTPYYGFEEDAVHWHKTAKIACDPFGKNLYQDYKQWCDDYFYLKHRQETRGVGGLFFDDINQWPIEKSFEFIQSVGDHYLPAYLPLIQKRKSTPFTAQQKDFQRYRRGRYVEFNLVFDRGTLFGLQFGGRTESILMSLPPEVTWRYNWQPEAGSAEAKLYEDFLKPRDWLA